MALDFTAGCAGGAAGVAFGYPLDTVKVKIQTQEIGDNGLKQYRGTYDCLSKIVKSEGARGLYKGMSSPLAGVAGINAITFGAYGNILRVLPNQESIGSITLAGSGAGLVQSFIVSPMELVKTQMQVCGRESISETVGAILRGSGINGLTRGLGITLTREVPAFGIYFGSYEICIREMGESTLSVLMGGGLAGVLSWIFTYPQDVIKSRLQADGFGIAQQYKGALHCLQQSLASEGPNVLLRGIGSTVIRAFPMNAVTFAVYSYIMKNWGYKDRDEDTLENLQKRLESQLTDMTLKLPSVWDHHKKPLPTKVTTLATDMPNIITIKEPTVSSISFARMYPEQMLWACPETPKKKEEFTWQSWSKSLSKSQSFSTYNYCNFNQFTQRNMEDSYQNLPGVLAPVKLENADGNENYIDSEDDLKIPSVLMDDRKTWNEDDEERLKSCITTKDFLIPTNLLSSRKTHDRIYGFYYVVP